MKISLETIAILHNFATIDKGLLFRPGNVLRTRTEAIYAEATVAETFPTEVGIADLSNLLSAISLFKQPELEFGDNVLRIYEADEAAQKAEVLYAYAGDNLVTLNMRKKGVQIPDEHISFIFSEDELTKLKKAVSIFQKPEIMLFSDGKEISLGTYNHSKRDQEQSYSMKLTGETNGYKCKQIFDYNNIKLMKGDYHCKSTALFTQFQHRTLELAYLIGSEPSSTFDGQSVG